MIEIVFGLAMAQIASQKAYANGRNPYLFYIIAIIIILAFEFLGVWITLNYLNINNIVNHLIVLIFGGVGGLVGVAIPIVLKKDAEKYELSDIETNNEKFQENSYSHVLEKKEAIPLDKACKIIIKREKSFYASLCNYNVKLNGTNIGFLQNGKQLTTETNVRNNIITVQATNGAHDTIEFSINNNLECVEIYFKGQKFLRNKSRGILEWKKI